MSHFTTLKNVPDTNTPEELVQMLIKLKANVRIYDFMLELKTRFYPKINMILYDDLSQYIGREREFCIDARMFYKYSKLCVSDYEFDLKTCDKKSNIKQTLESSNMEIDVDYLLLIDQEQHNSGAKTIKRYMMTPDSFYLLLMDIPDRYRRARQTFCKYHAFLTKVIKYYDNFQIGVSKLIEEEQMIRIRKEKTHTQLIGYSKDSTIDNISKKIDTLLEFGNKMINQNDKLQLTVDMTREELSDSLNHLINKSYHSTIDPEDESKITHVAALAPNNDSNEGKTILVRGQHKQIDKVKHKYSDTHIPVIDTTYNANAINLIENAKQKYIQMRDEYIYNYNIPIIAYNEKLKQEIIEYNKRANKFNKRNPATDMKLRVYSLEKKDKLFIGDIPIKFNNTSIWYKNNIHFAYDQVVNTINLMNKKTQMSPIKSD